MMYEVGYLIVPWTLFGIALIAVAKLWHMCMVLNRSNSKAQVELKKYVGVEGQYTLSDYRTLLKHQIRKTESAEASAREADAGHREAVRQLDEAQKDIRRWEKTCEETTEKAATYYTELAKYRPNRDKKGHFIPKKKVEKLSAKRRKGH